MIQEQPPFSNKAKSLRIVFMGTPEFAVASLRALVDHQYHVVAVVTAPDKQAGRGLQLNESAVKKFALQHHIPVLQPVRLKDAEFLQELHSYKADLQVVVAFRMLPEVVWNMPPMGTINVHGSLLPNYRGAAPINWVIINGETVTGVTTFKLQHEIDTGHIFLQEKISIGKDETAGSLHDRMMIAGAELLLKTINGLCDDILQEIPQENLLKENNSFHIAPKLSREDGKIDWNNDAEIIYNQIRGLSPYPAAWTILQDKYFKIFLAAKEYVLPSKPPGQWETDGKTYLRFAANNGWIYALEVQAEGKKRMHIEGFLRGYRLNAE
jgi:methionyl-tRNA formyltransferase